MGIEYRVLGPLEVVVAGRSVDLGPPRHRGVLVLLIVHANAVVPAHRLIDELWPDAAPSSASNLVQGAVSRLRKVLGKDAIVTRGAGYALTVEPESLDLHRFERLARAGGLALDDGHLDRASAALGEALALWRGPALADLSEEAFVRPIAGRLEELRLLALERRLEAELGLGRHADVLADIRALAHEHPLRERVHGLQMLALYACGRQAEALETYRTARTVLVEQLGISPGPALQELEQRILRQDPDLLPVTPDGRTRNPGSPRTEPLRSILVTAFVPQGIDVLIALAEPLARRPARELMLVSTVAHGGRLASLAHDLEARRRRLVDRGLSTRAAAFTSVAPGADVARMAIDHDVDLVLVDAPDGLLEDARVLALLDGAPCDVAVVAGVSSDGTVAQQGAAVVVPFGGTSHDWAAVEVGAWLARNTAARLCLAGASQGGPAGRDASRLLASASLAVQRAFGVPAEPVLVAPDADALVAATADAAVVVVGLTERWRREGLGRARTALATRASGPTLLVRRGGRPGGLAPRGADTRFTWTLAGA
jgi:DNA-binding SARP family transcriptional activator